MKTSLALGTLLFVLGVVLGLIQLWFAPWSVESFFKLELTLGALVCILIVVWFVVKEYREDQANRNGGRLD